MGEVHLDHPGEWSWFSCYGPLPIRGPCPHYDCPHDFMRDIAYGPDYDHYTLVQCDVPDGCNGLCRGWVKEYPIFIAYQLGIPRITWPDKYLGWWEMDHRPRCRDCGAIKSNPCLVCSLPDPYSIYGGIVSCIWCDGVKFVCPNGPHFTGIASGQLGKALKPRPE